MENCPKRDVICRLTLQDQGKDYKGRAPKVVLFVHTNASAMTLYLYLTVVLKLRSAFYHSQLTASERDETIKSFQLDQEVRCFVATAGVGGTGITLTSGMRLIIVEPESNSGLFRQIIARVHRYKNNNIKGIFGYKVWNSGAPAEREALYRR